MIRARSIARQGIRLVLPALALTMFGWFGYVTLQGDRGLAELSRLKAEIARAEASQEALAAEHRRLAHRVARLRPASLDADLLEERARLMTGMTRAGDVIVLTAVPVTPR